MDSDSDAVATRDTVAVGVVRASPQRRSLAVVWLVQTVGSISVLAFGPLAPFLQADLGLSRGEIGALASAFYLTSFVVLIPAGWIIDQVGVARVLVIGQLTLGIMLLVASLAPSYGVIVVLVALAGIGTSVSLPSTTKAIIDWFPASSRATAMSVKQTGYTVGGVLSGIILPAIAVASSWRMALIAVSAMVFGSALVSRLAYRDYRGSVYRHAALGELGFSRFMTDRDLLLIAAAAGAFNLVQSSFLTYLTLYLHEAVLLPVVVAGAYLALIQGSGIFGRIGWGMASDRLLGGRRRQALGIVAVGAMISSLAMAWLTPETPTWALVVLMLFGGVMFLGWAGVYLTIVAEIGGRQNAGVAVGAASSLANIGILIGPPIFGYLVDASGSYPVAYCFLAAVMVIGLAALRAMRDSRQVVEA